MPARHAPDRPTIHPLFSSQPDTMWLVEQIPGLVVGGDVTQILEMGHFPMFNVPFWPEIYARSGYPETLARFGLDKRSGHLVGSPLAGAPPLRRPAVYVRRSLCPACCRYRLPIGPARPDLPARCEQMRRRGSWAACQRPHRPSQAGKVHDLATFVDIMRYNEYKTDPYSKASPLIAAPFCLPTVGCICLPCGCATVPSRRRAHRGTPSAVAATSPGSLTGATTRRSPRRRAGRRRCRG